MVDGEPKVATAPFPIAEATLYVPCDEFDHKRHNCPAAMLGDAMLFSEGERSESQEKSMA